MAEASEKLFIMMTEASPTASHVPPEQPTLIRKPARTTVHSDGRKIIAKVAECCDIEKQNKQLILPLNKSIERVAAYTGKSVNTVRRIKSFCASHPNETPKTPGKKRTRVRGKMEIEEVEKRVIRDTIEDFYINQKVVPTLKKLIPILREKIQWRWSATSLRKVLKSMGFIWKKVQNKRVLLLERADIVDCRVRFLVQLKNVRETNREVFYLDESWIDNYINVGKCWQKENDVSGGTAWGSASKRIIVASVGSKRGFMKEAQLIFAASSMQGDYRGPMNSSNFEKWFTSQVLPNLPPSSVLVIDNAPYHSRQFDKTPSRYDTKMTMISWLERKGVACNFDMTKTTLYSLIDANKSRSKTYVVDVMAAEMGHSIIRLPPYNCDLNPVDLAWKKIKNVFRERSITGDMSATNLQKLAIEAFSSVTATDWEEYFRKVQELELEYWIRDGEVENAIDELIINAADDTSDEGDSSEESEFELSESE